MFHTGYYHAKRANPPAGDGAPRGVFGETYDRAHATSRNAVTNHKELDSKHYR